MRVAGLVLLLAVVLVFFGACENGSRSVSAEGEEKRMSTATKPEMLPVPPIDAMAPARIATATFAMG